MRGGVMAVSGPPIQEVATVLGNLSEAYTIGIAAEAAGLSGGVDLQIMVRDFLAGLAEDYSFVRLALESGTAPETGWFAGPIRLAILAGNWLKGAAVGTFEWFVANPAAASGLLTAGTIAGTLGVSYAWLTSERDVELERIQSLAELQRHNFNLLPPEDRLRGFDGVTAAVTPRTELSNWLLGGVFVGLGLLAWHVWQQRN